VYPSCLVTDSHRKYRGRTEGPSPAGGGSLPSRTGAYFWFMALGPGRAYVAARSNRAQEAVAIVRRLALSLAIIVNLLATSAAWGAASCPPSHEPQLSAGGATPASGTTATVFTFTVTYADTKGCAPNWVRVTVAGKKATPRAFLLGEIVRGRGQVRFPGA